MSYEKQPGDALDYEPCQYGSSKLLLRGPRRRLQSNAIAFLGGNETFGLFMPAPYPALFEEETGVMAINLGARDAGIDAYVNAPGLLDICAMSRVTVIQVMGAVNMSNRLYTVDPRRNDRFLRASATLKTLYPELDFSEFLHTTTMLTELARTDRERFDVVKDEVQTAWVARMNTLMEQIGGTIVLLWLAGHAPYGPAKGGSFLREPVFVSRAMLDAIRRTDTHIVEVVATPEDIAAGQPDLVFRDTEAAAASEMLGLPTHKRAADALTETLSDLT